MQERQQDRLLVAVGARGEASQFLFPAQLLELALVPELAETGISRIAQTGCQQGSAGLVGTVGLA